jgi:hypothetical protein
VAGQSVVQLSLAALAFFSIDCIAREQSTYVIAEVSLRLPNWDPPLAQQVLSALPFGAVGVATLLMGILTSVLSARKGIPRERLWLVQLITILLLASALHSANTRSLLALHRVHGPVESRADIPAPPAPVPR